MEQIQHLLLVEDHVIFRSSLRDAMQYQFPHLLIYEVGSGEQAVDFVQHHPCDFILMDIQMPRMSGIEALVIIRSLTLSNQPGILMLSTFDHANLIHDALISGANGYAVKNIDPKELHRAIKLITEGEQYLHPEIRAIYLQFAAQKESKLQPDIVLLSPQEKLILKLVCLDMDNQEIAEELNIGYSTVAKHKANLKAVIGAKTLAGMVNFALFYEIISREELFASKPFRS